MPNGNYAIGNTYETVTRPMAFAIAKDCLARLGFPQDAFLSIPGHTEQALVQGSTIDNNFESKNWFGTNTEAILKIKEDPIVDRIYEASVIRRDNNVIFKDAETHVYVRPVYQPTKATLTFRLRCKDEIEASKIRDDTWARSHLLRHEQVHTLTYHWQIPEVFLVILHEIWMKQEAHDKTGDSFPKYLKDRFDPRVDTVTNLAGKGGVLVVPEDQVRVLGWFDFSGVMDEPTFNKDNGTWDLEWSYSVVYDKPIEAVLDYPLVVRQKMLGADFRPKHGMYKLSDQDVDPNTVNRTLGSFFNVWTPPKGILDRRYPDFDTWQVDGGTRGCIELWYGLTTISEDNRQDMLSIDELGNHKLSDATREFIMSERKHVVDYGRSLFDIAVYSNNERHLNGQVELTEEGMIRSLFEVSMVPTYHVVIAFRNNLYTLSWEDQDRLRQNACRMYEVLVQMYPALAAAGQIPKPSRRCFWTREEWEWIVDIISPPRPGVWPRPSRPDSVPGGHGGGNLTPGQRRILMLTVGSYNILTRR